MRRITTTVSLVAAALWFGALPVGASDGPERVQPAPDHVPPAALDPRRIPDDVGAAETAPVKPEPEYVVQQGDTLAQIAERKLGSPDKWKLLARTNGIDDPRELRVGQKLKIPTEGS